MTESAIAREVKTHFRAGARSSALSLAQTDEALRLLGKEFPSADFTVVPMSTPGDRDLSTPIEQGAADFFTRDLDDALRAGKIDFAVHSAKDLPERIAGDIDWFWLPLAGDPRDAWVYPETAESIAALQKRANIRIGVSSARRARFAAETFPGAETVSMRGAVDSRIRQMMAGAFDAAIMAKAGLDRLYRGAPPGVRVEPIPAGRLPVPDGQGRLAITFRKGDMRLARMRWRFVKAVRFVSAGVGDAGMCTIAGAQDLRTADVVLHDALTGEGMSALVSAGNPEKRIFDVGKRCGAHSMEQADITRLICDEARKGRRVARLKGGDAGLFGRLSEETDALAELDIPFVVRPGVSALVAATTGTGMLLTRRGKSDGFTVRTPRSSGTERPYVAFMAVGQVRSEAAALVAAGRDPATPCAVVYDALGPREETVRSTLGSAAESGFPGEPAGRPGLFIAGECTAQSWPASGELGGKKVLLACSDDVAGNAALRVEDMGGRPIRWPMIRLRAADNLGFLADAGRYDAIVLTSPAAVRIFFENRPADRRRLPEFYTCGTGTAARLREYGVEADLVPETDHSSRGLAAAIRENAGRIAGKRVLRLRSDKAGREIADALAAAGAETDDRVLYVNETVERNGPLPAFDAAYFASSSAVEAFAAAYGAMALDGKDVFVRGEPTRRTLERIAKSATPSPVCRLRIPAW